jgi:hypothetical protein
MCSSYTHIHILFGSCYEFVEYCVVHGTFAVSPVRGFQNFPYCCDILFDRRPFFSEAGTCFTTNASVQEFYASTLSSIKIYLTVDSHNTPSNDDLH